MSRNLIQELNQAQPASGRSPRNLLKELGGDNIIGDFADEPPGGIKSFAIGVGSGVKRFGQGIAQAGLEAGEAVGLVDEGKADDFSRRTQQEIDFFRQTPVGQSTSGKVGQFVGQVAPTLVIPGGAAVKAKGALNKIGAAAATGAASGGAVSALDFVEQDSTRAGKAALGAGFGAVTGGLISGAGSAISKFRGAGKADLSTELNSLSKEFDIPITVGEARGSQAIKRIETVLERMPLVGTGAFREQQVKAANKAAEKLTKSFDDGFEDVGLELQKSLKRKREASAKISSALYDKVEEAVKQAGDPPVDLNNMREAAQKAVADLNVNSDVVPVSETAKYIESFADAEPRNFGMARALRTTLLERIRQGEKQVVNGTLNDIDLSKLKRLEQALEKDIDQFAKTSSGKVSRLFRNANSFYKGQVVPFKGRDFRKILNDETSADHIIAKFIKRDNLLKGTKDEASRLVNNLDLRGKNALKFAVLSAAYEQAANKSQVGFSPAVFARTIESLGEANKVIFSVREKSTLDGLTKLMRVAQRAGQFAENPPTGQRLMDFSTGGLIFGALSNAGATASVLGGIKGASLLLTSERGRRLLTTANTKKINPGLIREINEEISKLSGGALRDVSVRGPGIAFGEDD